MSSKDDKSVAVAVPNNADTDNDEDQANFFS